MPVIHAVRTGSVKIKVSQRRRSGGGGIPRVLLDREWTDWLPIFAWAIEHEEGTIVVDTGETAMSTQPGYFPRWHPYYRWGVRMEVRPEDEIGPRLESIGLDPLAVHTVIMTHLHTDHAGGLHHFPNSRILVAQSELADASGWMGRARGYLPNRWPTWFEPSPIRFDGPAIGPFDRSSRVTRTGDVVVVPTPGHTPGHVSVIVRSGDMNYFLAGDTSYAQDLLLERIPDGVTSDTGLSLATMDRIRAYAAAEPTVYLPSHDPESESRLARRRALLAALEAPSGAVLQEAR